MYCCSCAEKKKSGYGLGKHKRNYQNEKKNEEKSILVPIQNMKEYYS